ncbi:hypothetical protein LLS1_24410 [Leifsonia sp. LS1]|uniref:sensor histidine kinase n=1 Tax=Leifsonia sp. LS1 TaxID=2828483 RepID=UPI001CFD2B10|nr:sensor histidine kinase [Leifsonia sp. LS1]GIT80772.1 hypothetical protein LLS1_24410 [Leifsonia sp. LS1]
MPGELGRTRSRLASATGVALAGLSVHFAIGCTGWLVYPALLLCAAALLLDTCPPYTTAFVAAAVIGLAPDAIPFAWYVTFVLAVSGRRSALSVATGVFLTVGGLLPLVLAVMLVGTVSGQAQAQTWILVAGEATVIVAGVLVRRQTLAARRSRPDEQGPRIEELVEILHDQLGHRLALLNLYASTLQNRRSLSHDEEEQVSQAIQYNVREAATTLATLLSNTTPPSRTPLADLNNLLLEFRAAGIPIHAQLTDQIEDFAQDVCLFVFRFVRECLTNAAKHGSIRGIDILVSYDRVHDVAGIVVRSASGAPAVSGGVARVESSSGLGLASLREQAAALGGAVQVGAEPGVFTVSAEVPLRRNAA